MSSWIKDKVVEVAKAEAEETGKDAEDIIWQLSKELGKMVEAGRIDANVSIEPETRLDRIQKIAEKLRQGSDYTVVLNAPPGEFSPKEVGDAITQAYANNHSYDSAAPEFDVIKKPSHYAEGRKYEPKDVIRDWGLNFNLGSSVKYIARCGRKDDAVQELDKAITFLEFERDARKAERDAAQD